MILITAFQDNMEKKMNIRALMQEKLKALKERKAVKVVKKSELSPKMQEFIDKAKAKAKERNASQNGAMKPSELKERMLAKRNEIKSIVEKKKQQLNKKEVNHD